MKKLVAIALILLGIGVLCAYFVFDKNDIGKFKGDPYLQEKTVAAEAISSIHVETDTYSVTFVKGNTEDIQMRLEGNVSKKMKIKLYLIRIPKAIHYMLRAIRNLNLWLAYRL